MYQTDVACSVAAPSCKVRVRSESAHLVSVHHEVVCGDQGLEDHHPAVVGGPLKQRVCQLRNAHVHLVGAVDQVCQQHTGTR